MTKVYEIKTLSDDMRGGKSVVASVSSLADAKAYLEANFVNHTLVGFDIDEANDAADAFLAPANKKVGYAVMVAVEAA